MAKLFFVLLFIGTVFAQKTEEVQLTLTFETPQKVPALFTSLGDHVVMTIQAWSTKVQFRNATKAILQDIPPKYAWKRTDIVFPIYIDHSEGVLWMKTLDYIVISPLRDFGPNVGFADLTVTYAIK